MATLVKIRGLDRGSSVVADNSVTGGSYRGFRVPSGLGQQFPSGAKAALSTNLTGSNNDLTYTAKFGGTYGNKIQVAYIDPSANSAALSVTQTYTSGTGTPLISVSLATDSGGAITSTAAQIATAVAAHPGAAQFVTVANKTGNDGTGVVTAMSATNLASGTDVGTGQSVYLMVTNKSTVIVDVDDPQTARALGRNIKRFVSLGAV